MTKIECQFCGAINPLNTRDDKLQEIVFKCWDCLQDQTVKLKLKTWKDPLFKEKEWYITPTKFPEKE